MDAKCPKCENTSFTIVKREDKIYCYVVCKECESIVGVLEDIDLKKHNEHVIRNHGFFENRINQLENELNELKNQNKIILEMVEVINNNTYKLLKKVN